MSFFGKIKMNNRSSEALNLLLKGPTILKFTTKLLDRAPNSVKITTIRAHKALKRATFVDLNHSL